MPKKHLLCPQAASTTRRTAAVSPPTEARERAAGSSSWGPGCQVGAWKPTKRGFSWIFIDFTMNFTMNFTHKPWLKVGLLSEDFPHVPQKTHTKKKSQSPGVHNQTVLPSLKNLPPPPAATSAGEAWLSQLLICLDGGTAALDTKRCLVASTQNTFDSQKLSDGKINLGLKIDNRTTFWNR